MPPVRWKLLIPVALFYLLLQIANGDLLQDTISVTADGWRPIIGKSHRDVNDEITIYKNPSQIETEGRTVKAQPVVQTTVSTLPSKQYQTISTSEPLAVAAALTSNLNIKNVKKSQVSKTPTAHLKVQQPIVLIPKFTSHGHGPHIPLSSNGQSFRRIPTILAHPHALKAKRPIKPIRATSTNISNLKNEILVPASSTGLGTYAFFSQPLGTPIRPAVTTNKHYHLVHPQYSPQFGTGGSKGGNDVVIQQVPVRTILIQNQHPGNHYIKHDQFSKNLVPPPISFIHQDSSKLFGNQNEPHGATEKASIHPLKLAKDKYKDHKYLQDSLPPPFHETDHFDDIEVEVTKEKFKTYHNNIPSHYNIQEEENDDYNFEINKKPIDGFKKHVPESYSNIKNLNHELKTNRNKVPFRDSHVVTEESKRERLKKPASPLPSYPTYEVTEGKQWQINQQFLSTKPSPIHNNIPSQPPTFYQQIEHTAFLPTPYDPDNPVPTLASQDEISSIYKELNKKKNPNYHPSDDYYEATSIPDYFNIKEVSTHYPVLGKIEYPKLFSPNSDYTVDSTTAKTEHKLVRNNYQHIEEKPESTISPVIQDNHVRHPTRKRRPQHKRTSTTSTTTTTEEPSHYTAKEEDNYPVQVNPSTRRTRKPIRRPTHSTPVEITTKAELTTKSRPRFKFESNRIKTTSSTEADDIPVNHKSTEDTINQEINIPSTINTYNENDNYNNLPIQPTTEDAVLTYNNEVFKTETKYENEYGNKNNQNIKYELVDHDEEKQSQTYADTYSLPELTTPRHKRPRYTTTEAYPTLNAFTPENEIDVEYSTYSNRFEIPKETVTVSEIQNRLPTRERYSSTVTGQSTTTTTTTEASTTTKSIRIRRPVNKYDNKNRPRFSVKEYKEKLNQYSTTSTDSPKSSTESTRLRFPNRARKPITPVQETDTTTERTTKFTPKEPRFTSTNNTNENTERKISTRIRNYGNRVRSTTEATSSTQKPSTKPKIFSNLRRPTPVSLKNRITNKQNRTNVVEEKPTEKPTPLDDVSMDNIPPFDSETEPSFNKVLLSEKKDVIPENEEIKYDSEDGTNDVFLLSQRISNLTSSAQNEYDTPGLFKAVSPNSRIVPSYFTISTDDPILPIEAFFPNIKDRSNKDLK